MPASYHPVGAEGAGESRWGGFISSVRRLLGRGRREERSTLLPGGNDPEDLFPSRQSPERNIWGVAIGLGVGFLALCAVVILSISLASSSRRRTRGGGGVTVGPEISSPTTRNGLYIEPACPVIDTPPSGEQT
jgi:hypothetical protein